MKRLRTLWAAKAGTTAAEFAMLLPLLTLLLLGAIDGGRYLWACNRAEKATQMGARFAVVTDMVPGGLAGYDFAIPGDLTQGDPIPQSKFGGATCQSSGGVVSCTCDTGQTCPPLGTANATAFANILARMQLFYPALTADNLVIKYQYSGLGYAGDPNGSDVAPLVVVQLRNLTFTPNLYRFVGASTLPLPSFSTALTLEDGSGAKSN
jgi:hypothetical protein